MDTSRTKRRFALYEKSVSDFLHYFSLKDRIVRVDTSAAQVQHIWEAMMDFFAAEMDFSANKVINTVVLFSFGKFICHVCGTFLAAYDFVGNTDMLKITETSVILSDKEVFI